MRNASYIVDVLNKNGYDSYFVGGWVRDLIRDPNNKPEGDIDIATAARPEVVLDIFNKLGYSVVPTGIAHGTVTIVMDSIPYEITTFRKDVSCDGRNATVSYASSIDEDLSRRDFTINAIAYNPVTDTYIDPFNGAYDISRGVIRTVGEPLDRFREDYLRLFRAFRFMATFDFYLDSDTEMAIFMLARDAHKHVSPERIKMELDKCFKKAKLPSLMMYALVRTGLLDGIMPELVACDEFKQNKHHMYDVLGHTMRALNAVPKEYHLIRYAALFHDLGKVSSRRFENGDYTFYDHESYSVRIASSIMKRLKFSNDEISYILNLVQHHMFKYSDKIVDPETGKTIGGMSDAAIRRLVASVGIENIKALCILKYADRVGNGKKAVGEMDIDSIGLSKRLAEMDAKEKVFKIKDLAIDGNDVMTILGIDSGPEVGKYLKMLYEIVIEDPSKNTVEYLGDFLRKIK